MKKITEETLNEIALSMEEYQLIVVLLSLIIESILQLTIPHSLR